MEPSQSNQQGHTGLPISYDDATKSEHNGPNDTFTPYATTPGSLYANGASLARTRRNGTIQQPSFDLTDTASAGGGHFVGDSALGTDVSSFRSAHTFADHNTGSLTSSPLSGVTSPLYNTNPGFHHHRPHYHSVPSYASTTDAQHQFPVNASAFTVPRAPPLPLESTSSVSGSHLNHLRSSLSHLSTGDREAYASPNHHLQRTHNPSYSFADYQPREYTPRAYQNITDLGLSSPGPTYHHPLNMNPGTVTTRSTPSHERTPPPSDCSLFPFPDFQHPTNAKVTCDGREVEVTIRAAIEKGFFQNSNDNQWTCYRRNYFSLNANYGMKNCVTGGRMILHREGKQDEIKAIGINAVATVDGPGGKGIDLIQHTAKRDAGPKTIVRAKKILPDPALQSSNPNSFAGSLTGTMALPNHMNQLSIYGHHHPQAMPPICPALEYQSVVDIYPEDEEKKREAAAKDSSSAQPQSPRAGNHAWDHGQQHGMGTSATFERVQFKCATANNGKRRASQQFFHVMLEVVVDVRKRPDDIPQWVKVASLTSGKVVVRGRSPSHYKNEGSSGSRNRHVTQHPHQPVPHYHPSQLAVQPLPGFHHAPNTGAFRNERFLMSPHGHPTYNPMDHHPPHPQHYTQAQTTQPLFLESSSPDESVAGGASDEDPNYHVSVPVLPDNDIQLPDATGYQYNPSTLYEQLQQTRELPRPKMESQSSTEPRLYSVNAEFPSATPGPAFDAGSPPAKYEGFGSSTGFFPNLN